MRAARRTTQPTPVQNEIRPINLNATEDKEHYWFCLLFAGDNKSSKLSRTKLDREANEVYLCSRLSQLSFSTVCRFYACHFSSAFCRDRRNLKCAVQAKSKDKGADKAWGGPRAVDYWWCRKTNRLCVRDLSLV